MVWVGNLEPSTGLARLVARSCQDLHRGCLAGLPAPGARTRRSVAAGGSLLGYPRCMSIPISDRSGLNTLGDIARKWAVAAPERTALRFGGVDVSYAGLHERSNRVAQALLADGLKPGDRVALLAKDSHRTFEWILGAAKAGLVVLGLNWRLRLGELEFILQDAGARALFGDPEFTGPLGDAVPGRAIDFSGPEYAAWRDAAANQDPHLDRDPESVVVQMYTSGTTGLPKGVMLAHRSFFAVLDGLAAAQDPWIGWSTADVNLLCIPSFHIGGLWWAMVGLQVGAQNVVLASFVASELLDAIESRRVTRVCLVPAMLQVALGEPGFEGTDLSSLRTIVYGGSPIPRPLMERAMRGFACDFAQIYGLTETGNTAVCLRPEDHSDLEAEWMTAAGRPYPGVEIAILGATGEHLGPREAGEIAIRSGANMVGYWQRPEATAEALRDGWIHTGDGGFLDERGFCYVHDRLKDMIIYAGENVYPAEIESVLCEHEGVLEAAVIGVPDERWGEVVKAIVVKRSGAEVRVRALLSHARERLADFKVPKSVDFMEALPRTPSGKIQKAVLREPYWAGRDRQVN